MSTENFQLRVMNSIAAICEAREVKDYRQRRSSYVVNLSPTSRDERAPTVSSEAKVLHDFISGFGIGNAEVPDPSLQEIHAFLSEVTKDFHNPPLTIRDAIDKAKSKGFVLSSTLEVALIVEY